MTILVTGATGLIGCHAVAELLSGGQAVRALVRDAEKLERVLAPLGHACRDLEVIEGELNDRAGLMRALGGCTGLLHCAGRFSPDRADAPMLWETNVEGTRYVLEAGRSAGVERAVYVSSILALFPPAGPSLTAADPVATPAEMYASTKAEAERAARAAQSEMPLTIVYPAAVQGPHDPTFSVGPQLVADALRNGRVLVTEGGLPSTDVRDLVTLIRCVFEGAATSTRLMAPSFFMASSLESLPASTAAFNSLSAAWYLASGESFFPRSDSPECLSLSRWCLSPRSRSPFSRSSAFREKVTRGASNMQVIEYAFLMFILGWVGVLRRSIADTRI